MIRANMVATAVLAAVLACGHAARAEGRDPVAAEALFDEGRRLLKDGRYAEACANLEASQNLDPGVGTLLNLGDCLEQIGRTASAWARFREAASLAVTTQQGEREREARARGRALEQRLVRIVLRPAPAIATDAELQITRDGIVVNRDVWETAVPVDPGKHEVRVTSPGKRPWSVNVLIEDSLPPGSTRTVHIPPLVPERETFRWGTQRTYAVTAAAIGVVGLGTGSVLALGAKSTYDDAASQCPGDTCSAGARDRAMSAGQRADVATAVFIGSAVALAVGVVLFLIAPKE